MFHSGLEISKREKGIEKGGWEGIEMEMDWQRERGKGNGKGKRELEREGTMKMEKGKCNSSKRIYWGSGY